MSTDTSTVPPPGYTPQREMSSFTDSFTTSFTTLDNPHSSDSGHDNSSSDERPPPRRRSSNTASASSHAPNRNSRYPSRRYTSLTQPPRPIPTVLTPYQQLPLLEPPPIRTLNTHPRDVASPTLNGRTTVNSLPDASSHGSSLHLNPTNFVSLSRKSTCKGSGLHRVSTSIKGPFTVNPFLHIPAALLTPVEGPMANRRKNLSLEVENGGINVDISLVGEVPTSSPLFNRTRQTTVDLTLSPQAKRKTHPLIARLHTPLLPRPSVHLTASGVDGYVSIHLPSSFRGLVTINVASGDLNAHISLSPEFTLHTIVMSETGTTRGFFFGELGGWDKGEQGWTGDRAEVSVNAGKIRLQVDGEPDWDALRSWRWRMGL